MAALETLNQRLSYIIGENMATQMKADGLEIDPIALAQAVNDVLVGNPSALSTADKQSVVEELQKMSLAQAETEDRCCSDSACCG